MEEKFCNGCQKFKLISEFWKKHDKPQARCKDCQRTYHKKHYKNNLESYKDRAKKRNQEITQALKTIIHAQKDKPCQDCGIKYPHYVMDFDHLPGEQKLFNMARATCLQPSSEKLMVEIQKCDVVCSNCHRIRTYNRSRS